MRSRPWNFTRSTVLPTVVVLLGLSSSLLAEEPVRFEYRAVSLGKNEDKATRELNELMSDGWEIVGPLGANLTAFRRTIVEDAPSPSDLVPRKAPPIAPPVPPPPADLPAMMPPQPSLELNDAPVIPEEARVDASSPTAQSWSLVTYALDGIVIRENDPRCTWTLDGNRWRTDWITADGKAETASGVLKIQEEKDGLLKVDLIHTAGIYKGRTTYAIMNASGDYVKYCYSTDVEARPNQFVTTAGDERGLVLWQKVK